jgi:TRAP-type C4-dicarboxylate transport system permease small subunit
VRAGSPLGGQEIVDTERGGVLQMLQRTVAALVFAVMMASILLGVFTRVVLNQPLIWSVSIASLAFAWLIFFGAGLADWDDRQIQFDLVYARLPPTGQRIFRILGNLLVVGCMLLVIPGTIGYLTFLDTRRLQGLPVYLSYAHAPVLAFFTLTALLRGRLLVRDLRALWRREPA